MQVWRLDRVRLCCVRIPPPPRFGALPRPCRSGGGPPVPRTAGGKPLESSRRDVVGEGGGRWSSDAASLSPQRLRRLRLKPSRSTLGSAWT